MSKILIVGQEEKFKEYLKRILLKEGYQSYLVKKGAQVLDLIEEKKIDLIIFDWGLPDISSDSICNRILNNVPKIPLILLLEKQAVEKIVKKFKCGADDFIVKPIEDKILLARIKARLSGKTGAQNEYKIGKLILNVKNITVEYDGQKVDLTPQEFKLLELLVKNKGRVLTRNVILERVWGYKADVQTRVVDVYIGYLRNKLEKKAGRKLIDTVRGFGYIIKDK